MIEVILIAIFVLLWLLIAIAAGVVASDRGGGGAAYFIGGLFFGPIALGTAYLEGKRCSECFGVNHQKAGKCRWCQAAMR